MGTRHQTHDAMHSGESLAAPGDILVYDAAGRAQGNQ